MRAALLALASASAVRAVVVEHWWNVSYAMANPDGLYERRVIGVNGSWPPPPVVSHQGDTILMHVYNGLGDATIPTALHAHGMMFNGTSYYDGATGVTQCGIPAGETMDYYIDTTHNAGTFWLHGHYNGQYVDGLRSPSIIYPQNATGRSDNTTWDDEFTLIVSDWYHRQHEDLLVNDFLNWKNPTGAEPVPDSAVIYVAKNASYLNTNDELSAGVGVSDNATIPFVAGKTYKLRIINMSALAMFWIGIEDHDMQIIEVDGVEIEPYAIDTLTISVAQRYSVLVTAKNATDRNYALMVMQDTDMYDTVPDTLVVNNTVQIVYDTANDAAAAVEYDTIATINDTAWTPLLQMASAPADVEFELNVFFDTYDDGTNRASFNNVTYQTPTVPSIFTALSMGNDSFDTKVYGAMTNAFTYSHLQNVQLTVYNWDAGYHPFHLHGHEFQVIEKSFDVTSNDSVINPPTVEGQANPMRRDTITIPPTGKVVLRWRADNPGAWFFHCHIDWHLSSGLAAVMIEAPETFQANTTIPSQMYDHCAFWDRPTTGNVVGLNSTTDFKGQPWGPWPIKMGWTPKAIGALAGCIITALLGFATIAWYSSGELDEREIEEEVRRKVEAKINRKPLWKRVAGRD
ncbi:ferroxidase fet3 [Cryptotrichosporon argae]